MTHQIEIRVLDSKTKEFHDVILPIHFSLPQSAERFAAQTGSDGLYQDDKISGIIYEAKVI